jgi:hypothetical protein
LGFANFPEATVISKFGLDKNNLIYFEKWCCVQINFGNAFYIRPVLLWPGIIDLFSAEEKSLDLYFKVFFCFYRSFFYSETLTEFGIRTFVNEMWESTKNKTKKHTLSQIHENKIILIYFMFFHIFILSVDIAAIQMVNADAFHF